MYVSMYHYTECYTANGDLCSNMQYGTIRFGGNTEFHSGQWAGIELDSEVGKNDGSYGGIRYFTCKPKFGLFVPMNRISKAAVQQPRERRKRTKETKARDSLSATNKAIDAQAQLQMNTELQVRVIVRVCVCVCVCVRVCVRVCVYVHVFCSIYPSNQLYILTCTTLLATCS